MPESTHTYKPIPRLGASLRLMRLDRPVGIWLLMWPCWWGLALASGGMPSASLLIYFTLGAILMRSAGCIVNDLADRRIDAQVARTRNRPLASGELTPSPALVLLALLLCLSLLIVWQLPERVMLWAACSLILVASYPFMKRITWWPQAFLGLTFNIGVLIAFVSLHDTPSLAAWLLYAGGICWTIGYDTIYALQDKADDIRVGVKSTALRFGRYHRPIIGSFYALMMLCFAAAAVLSGLGSASFALLALAGIHAFWQVATLDGNQPANCLLRFKSNFWLGLLIYLALCVPAGV